MVGGANENIVSKSLSTAELIPDKCQIPSLPIGISWRPSLVLTNNDDILVCGGYNNGLECLALDEGNEWKFHSNLKYQRRSATAITFVFGGVDKPRV